ncbi:MAG: DUF4397 domain-containing protein [Anaerolineae bacterium]|nr:DUF4397 domain-containing protein [Anaerolineae bacterium]
MDPLSLQPPSQVRVVLANNALERVDIYLNGRVVASRFQPGNYSSQPVEVPGGQSRLEVVPSGSRNETETRLFSENITLLPDEEIILYLYGDAENLLIEPYPVDLSPLRPNQARLSIIHAVPRGPGINVFADDAPLAEALSYGQRQGPYELPAGTVQLRFDSGVRDLLVAPLELQAGRVYTALLLGDVASDRYELISFSQRSEAVTSLRLIHAIPDAGPLSLAINARFAGQLAFGEASEVVVLSAGRATLTIQDEAGTQLGQRELTLPENGRLDGVLFGLASAPQLAQVPINTTPIEPNLARLNLVHVIADEDQLMLELPGLVAPGNLREGERPTLRYGTLFGGTEVEAGLVELRLINQLGASENLAAVLPNLLIEAGLAYTIVATGPEPDDFLRYTSDLQVQSIQASAPQPDTLVQLRLLNALSDGTPLTLAINGEVVLRGVPADSLSSGVPIAANFESTLTLSNAERQVLAETVVTPLDDRGLTFVALGSAEDLTFVRQDDPGFVEISAGARVRFINAVQRIPTIAYVYYPDPGTDDVDPTSFERLGSALDYGESITVDLFAGDFVLRALESRQNLALFDAPFSLASGRFYEMLVREAANGDTLELVVIPRD